jgi:hypothetical protein
MQAFQASTLAPHPPFFFVRIEISLSAVFFVLQILLINVFLREKKPMHTPVSTLKSAIKATPTVFPLSLSCFFSRYIKKNQYKYAYIFFKCFDVFEIAVEECEQENKIKNKP